MIQFKRIPKKIRFQIYQNLFEIITDITNHDNINHCYNIKISVNNITKQVTISPTLGFCSHISKLYNIYFPNRNNREPFDYKVFNLLLPELYAKKPINNHVYWGDNSWRLKVIKEVLDEENRRNKSFYLRILYSFYERIKEISTYFKIIHLNIYKYE